MRNFLVRFVVLGTLVAGLMSVSCAGPDVADINLAPNESEHTLVMYMFAHNNLTGSMLQNVIAAEYGAKQALPGSNLVVYLDRADTTYLFRLKYLPYGDGEHIKRCELLKSYDKQDSHNPLVMRQVMEDVRTLVPSRSYGLVISGHGTGWFPRPSDGTEYSGQKVAPKDVLLSDNQTGVGTSYAQGSIASEYHFPQPNENSMTKYIGCDNYDINDSMVASEVVEGLKDMHFDYIIFDACFMASVEFLYDIRNLTDYVIASPVEVMNAGFPYSELVPMLLGGKNELKSVAEKIVDTYINTSYSSIRSIAVALIDCAELENLASVAARLYAHAKESAEADGCVDVLAETVDKQRVQPLDRVEPTAFYDLEDLGLELCGDNVSLMEEWKSAISRAVVYADNSDEIWSAGMNDYWNIEHKVDGVIDLCGLNTYLPITAAPITASYYLQTAWAQKVYSE